VERLILHLDIDAFFASVEQLRNPLLRGRPVIVGSGCIASCSYEARPYGLYAGQSLSEARRLCPGVVILEGNYSVYRCFAEAAWEACRRFSPIVETLLDDAYLDLAGTRRLYPDIVSAARRLKECIRAQTGLRVTVGIGPSRITARMASKAGKPDGLTRIRPAEVMSFLGSFAAGDLPGVGYKTAGILRRLNVKTVGDLQRLPREGLEALFGKSGGMIYERCRGRDTAVVSPREVPQTISRETTFHRETTSLDEIRGLLYYLTERTAKTLRELGCAARTVRLKICYEDFEREAASRSLPEASDLEARIYELALHLLGRLYRRRVALRSVGVSVSNISPAPRVERSLFSEMDQEKLRRLAQVMDLIRDRFGFSAIVAGRSLALLGKLRQDSYGYVLRTPSLTK
jgi:DNA polymerase-4